MKPPLKANRVLHRCLCGHAAPNYSQYRKHLARCPEWRDRPNPRGMAIWRWHKSTEAPKPVGVPTVEELEGDERFRQVLERNGMPAKVFAAVLQALEKRRFSR